MHPSIYERVLQLPASFLKFCCYYVYSSLSLSLYIYIYIYIEACLSNYCETCIGDRRFKDKKDAVEPEADPERDQRTVFAYQVDAPITYVLQVLSGIISVKLFCLDVFLITLL